jgi:hypothetical protein
MFNFLSNSKSTINFSIIWLFFFFNVSFFNSLPINFYFLSFLWLLLFFFFFTSNASSFNDYYLNLNYFFFLIFNKWFFFYISNLIGTLLNLFKFSKNNFFNLNLLGYKWNPLIKQYSYYGYFKSNISHWNYSKTDEIKKFKF